MQVALEFSAMSIEASVSVFLRRVFSHEDPARTRRPRCPLEQMQLETCHGQHSRGGRERMRTRHQMFDSLPSKDQHASGVGIFCDKR
jgi:hypothetical protein